MTKSIKFYLVRHPGLDKGFILTSQAKIKNFIKKNKKVWEKYELDTRLFTIEEHHLKDTALYELIEEHMPELLL